MFLSPGDLPDPGIERGSPTLQTDSVLSEPPNPLKILKSESLHKLLCQSWAIVSIQHKFPPRPPPPASSISSFIFFFFLFFSCIFSVITISCSSSSISMKLVPSAKKFGDGESQGRGSLVGCRLWGLTESDTTEATQQQQPYKKGFGNSSKQRNKNSSTLNYGFRDKVNWLGRDFTSLSLQKDLAFSRNKRESKMIMIRV